ncbi:hypothetical protein PIB30_049096 [Stylosanthes scabra]|uniref:Replication protein A 70 kDa DNA-binding subunit B/D first OB fold domain-containing protein n=1 Tax=Stylosanthes scabra TaxID=79078 RepID=A0ABU6SHX0_9FABA|nr:hypothetical protein [Stylosanthes scabra]
MESGRLVVEETGDETTWHGPDCFAYYWMQNQRLCIHLLLGDVAGCWLVALLSVSKGVIGVCSSHTLTSTTLQKKKALSIDQDEQHAVEKRTVAREDFLADVHSRKPDWNINVYVIRLWGVPTKSNLKVDWYIEMILQDRKGDRLHALLPCSLFKGLRDMINEFQLYNMRWLIVAEDKTRSKTTESDLVLTMSR